MYTIKNFCQYCGRLVRGRSDKRFCDDYCRNSHNNHRRSLDSGEMRGVIGILRTNQKILSVILRDGEEHIKVPILRLCEMGYNFKYHTHTNVCLTQYCFQFCFDKGIYRLNQDWVFIVRDLGESYLMEFSNKHLKDLSSSDSHDVA